MAELVSLVVGGVSVFIGASTARVKKGHETN